MSETPTDIDQRPETIGQQRLQTIHEATELLNAAKYANRLPGLLMIMLDGQGGYKSVWWTDEVTQTASLIGVAHVDIIRMVGRLVDNVQLKGTP
jgi:hypothetical protein